jgi:hypothetical protein
MTINDQFREYYSFSWFHQVSQYNNRWVGLFANKKTNQVIRNTCWCKKYKILIYNRVYIYMMVVDNEDNVEEVGHIVKDVSCVV